MTNLNLAHQRLYYQHITGTPFEQAGEVVAWLGAVQSQDYAGAKWALGQRMRGATDAAIERAFADGVILRTHVLRPTWHFVTPADIRWLLALTAPRVHALNAYYYRKLELDDAIFARSNEALVKALQGGRQLTRQEMAGVLQQASITADSLRLGYLLMRAELDGIICSGARRGNQFTYALLDERAPQVSVLERDKALAELVRRYFTSHGPATIKDFVWWSSLSTADAKAGLEMAKAHLVQEVSDGLTYWCSPSAAAVRNPSPTVYLLPAYDEYTVSYRDSSSDVLDPAHLQLIRNEVFTSIIAIDGQIVGTWKRTLKKETVMISFSLFRSLSPAESQAVAEAAQRYGEFLGLTIIL